MSVKYSPIFKFLRYVSPVWYFNLKPLVDHGYFPTLQQVRLLTNTFTPDAEYVSPVARELDLAWNAFQAGCILSETSTGVDVWTSEDIPVRDEYRFLRKNFHPFWSFYVLCMRIFSLHNPVTEVESFLRTRKVKRIVHATNPITYPTYQAFSSMLVASRPLVSVIIPTLNRYPWLNDVLNDLKNQKYTHVEVIIVDQSQPFQEEFYKNRNLNLKVWFQEEKALWKARNDAIRAAKGDYILLYDDDSRVDSDWIVQHLKTLDFFKADISAGVSISAVGDKVPSHYAYFRWSDQLDTGNVMIKKHVFQQVGLFDRQFEKQRMGDGEFGLRAYLAGFRNISNPYAKRVHLKVGEGGLRQMGSWDGWRPKSLLSPRPVPSVLYLVRKYFGNMTAYIVITLNLIPSLIPYRIKNNRLLLVITPLLFLIYFPFLVFQVLLSWKKSSHMLKIGPLIENLNM